MLMVVPTSRHNITSVNNNFKLWLNQLGLVGEESVASFAQRRMKAAKPSASIIILFVISCWIRKNILWNSMTLPSFVFIELANTMTMKYGRGVLYNLIFTEWRYCVLQNEVWGRGCYITLFSPSDVTAFHRIWPFLEHNHHNMIMWLTFTDKDNIFTVNPTQYKHPTLLIESQV